MRLRQRFDSKVQLPGYIGAADGTSGSPTYRQLHPGPADLALELVGLCGRGFDPACERAEREHDRQLVSCA